MISVGIDVSKEKSSELYIEYFKMLMERLR